jgi:hypothetical protein
MTDRATVPSDWDTLAQDSVADPISEHARCSRNPKKAHSSTAVVPNACSKRWRAERAMDAGIRAP